MRGETIRLKINHKSKDILKDFSKYIRNSGKFYVSLKEFKTILIGITTEIGNDDTLYLEAEIQQEDTKVAFLC